MAKNLQTKFSTRQYMLSRDFESTIIMSRHLKRFPYIRMITMSFIFPGRGCLHLDRGGAVSFKIWRYGADTSGDKAHGDGAWK